MPATGGSKNIQVTVKVRPLIKREKIEKLTKLWRVKENTIQLVDPPLSTNNDGYTFGEYILCGFVPFCVLCLSEFLRVITISLVSFLSADHIFDEETSTAENVQQNCKAHRRCHAEWY